MHALVTYLSSSGNTKQVAMAIHDGIEGDKEIKPLNEIKTLEPYDVVFLGFPIIAQGAPRKVRQFLTEQARGKKVALFITHGMPGDMELLAPMLGRCRAAAQGSVLVGVMDSQGKMVNWMTKLLRLYPNTEVRRWVRSGGERIGIGHPSAGDLDGARTFAREIITTHGQPHVGQEAIRG
jgi:hypothetical protein